MSLKILALSSLLLIACQTSPGNQVTLQVCARPNTGFFEENGRLPSGLEFDLLSSFAEKEGIDLDISWLDSFGEIIPSVREGRCDVGAAGIMITEQRSHLVDFSEPYFPVRVVLIGLPNSTRPSLESLADARVAVVSGTVHEEYATSHDAELVVAVSSDEELFSSLSSKKADFAICDSAIVLPFLEQYPELQILDSMSERSFFGFALVQESKWQQPLSQHIRALKESGEYRKFLVDGFGKAAAAYLVED